MRNTSKLPGYICRLKPSHSEGGTEIRDTESVRMSLAPLNVHTKYYKSARSYPSGLQGIRLVSSEQEL